MTLLWFSGMNRHTDLLTLLEGAGHTERKDTQQILMTWPKHFFPVLKNQLYSANEALHLI